MYDYYFEGYERSKYATPRVESTASVVVEPRRIRASPRMVENAPHSGKYAYRPVARVGYGQVPTYWKTHSC